MAEIQNNIPVLHRKEWQTMMPAPTATAANSFVVFDPLGQSNYALYMLSATVHYLYHHDEDDWVQIPSGAFSPALTAGACGAFHPWSITYTGNGGSTTTIQVAAATHNIVGSVVGGVVEFLSGTAANLGLRRTITAIKADNGTGNITLTLDSALPSAFASTDTFRCNIGSFFIFTSGIVTTSSFRRFDLGTMSWVGTLSITGIAATFGTDGRMVSPARYGVSYDTGTATSATGTTLVDSGAGWGVDQFINFQVRITGGTGIGQIRTITDNDATSITVATWTTTPDATSTYSIEGDENSLYLLGNNAVTMYKYSISGNTWATVSPTTARAGAAIAGMSADFVGVTGDAGWANVAALKDGRYIYSLRGGTSVIDRFDISGGTNGAGAWLQVSYPNNITTFAAGDSTFMDGRYLYIAKEGSATVPQRFYKFSVRGNYLEPVTTDWYLGGAAAQGNKIWVKSLSSTGAVKWIYCLQQTVTNLRRIMVY